MGEAEEERQRIEEEKRKEEAKKKKEEQARLALERKKKREEEKQREREQKQKEKEERRKEKEEKERKRKERKERERERENAERSEGEDQVDSNANDALSRVTSEELSVSGRLKQLHTDLRSSLSVSSKDHGKCMVALQKISELSLTTDHLMENKVIIETLKKVKAYKESDQIAEKAAHMYNHFKSMFRIAGAGLNSSKPAVKPISRPTGMTGPLPSLNGQTTTVEEAPVSIPGGADLVSITPLNKAQ